MIAPDGATLLSGGSDPETRNTMAIGVARTSLAELFPVDAEVA